MALSSYRYPPNVIWLGGEHAVKINDLVAGEAITPGHLIERYNASGTPKFRKHASAGGATAPIVALDQNMMNLGVDDAYAAGDLVEAMSMPAGATAWMLLASGQNIVAGQQLESNGDGTLIAKSSGVALYTALEAANNSTGSAPRVKAEAI